MAKSPKLPTVDIVDYVHLTPGADLCCGEPFAVFDDA